MRSIVEINRVDLSTEIPQGLPMGTGIEMARQEICRLRLAAETVSSTQKAPAMVMPILLALLFAIIPASASGQQPGYTPCTDSIADKPIIGRWLHDSVQTHGAFAGVRVWARLEIRADGEIVEDYFTCLLYTSPSPRD